MRVVTVLLLACLAVPAAGQAPGSWCGQYLIGSGPNAPRAAVASVPELARHLPRQCSAGDILYVTMLQGIAGDVAPMLCDYRHAITVEAHPRDRGGGTSVTCVWNGGIRGSR